jgi:hypothetical protein
MTLADLARFASDPQAQDDRRRRAFTLAQLAPPGFDAAVGLLGMLPQSAPRGLLDIASQGAADPGGFNIDTSRPRINNSDGSFSTERTITIEADGKHYLIPTIVGGQQLSPDAAIKQWRSGANKAVGVYGSATEAERAAIARSREIGRIRKDR